MQKILIIGCPGSGKSTFARRLRDATGLPLHYLDRLWYRPDRTTIPREEFDAALEVILAGDQWIIDGNYSRTMERRLQACDTVFLLDFPTEVCVDGALQRIGCPREDMPWIEQKADPELMDFIATFRQNQLPSIYELLNAYCNKQIVIFHNRKEMDNYRL